MKKSSHILKIPTKLKKEIKQKNIFFPSLFKNKNINVKVFFFNFKKKKEIILNTLFFNSFLTLFFFF